MARGFTNGMITGAIIGMTVGMMFPSKTNSRARRKVFKNGSHFIKRVGNMFDNIIDLW